MLFMRRSAPFVDIEKFVSLTGVLVFCLSTNSCRLLFVKQTALWEWFFSVCRRTSKYSTVFVLLVLVGDTSWT
jgi:hypothetical protein